MSYAQPKDSGSRLTGFVLVMLLHVLLVYALINGLARKIVEVVKAPLETKIIEEIKPPPDKPPPPPPPRLKTPPPPYIPPPEVQVQMPQTALRQAISAVSAVKPPVPLAPPGQRPVRVTRTPPVVDANACEKPEYPRAALRAQETGIVVLGFLIDVNGTILQSKVERSSGSRRLDEAALKGLGLCRFKPGTVDGTPERTWARIEYEWKIED